MLESPRHALQKRRRRNVGNLSPPEEWKRVEQHAAQHDEKTASHDLFRIFARQMRGDSDDEKKKWKDQIGWRPTVPFRMFERRVDRVPRARIVDEEHSRDGGAAKNVERGEARARVIPSDCQRLEGSAVLMRGGPFTRFARSG